MKAIGVFLVCFLLVISLCGCVAIDGVSSITAQNTEGTQSQKTDAVLIDNDNMKVTFQGVEDMPSLGVFYVNLKIENRLSDEIVVTLESADVDGETIPLITTGVPLKIHPGNSGSTGFVFSMLNLSINTVTDAKNATFKVALRSAESYDILVESKLVTVNLNK